MQYPEQRKDSVDDCPTKIFRTKAGRRKILCGYGKREGNTNATKKTDINSEQGHENMAKLPLTLNERN